MENERAWLFRLSNRTTSDLCSSGTNEDLEAIATLKLYAAGEGNSLAVGISPSNVVFDGSGIGVKRPEPFDHQASSQRRSPAWDSPHSRLRYQHGI
jgi:hypothetical protein